MLKRFYKKFFTLALIAIFFQPVYCMADVLRGEVKKESRAVDQRAIFTGETDELEKGTKVKMSLSTMLGTDIHQVGDDFFAAVTTDVFDEKNQLIIPAGTVAHGKIKNLKNAKSLGRDAYIELGFDYLLTPDGREIPIRASMTTRKSAVKRVAKSLTEGTVYTVASGVIGGMTALNVLGGASAAASSGATLVGGAGIGLAAGLGYSIFKGGRERILPEGQEITVKIDKSIELPVLNEQAFMEKEVQYKGLFVEIKNYKVQEDPFGEPNTIALMLDVDNKTNKTFSSFDIALVSNSNSMFYPSPFGNTDLWFKKIKPNSRARGTISFSVDNPNKKHWLVFYDSSTRKELAKISVDNAKRRIAKGSKSK